MSAQRRELPGAHGEGRDRHGPAGRVTWGSARCLSLDLISPGEAPVLCNLFELYAHDFSQYVALEIGGGGRFDVPIREPWWTSANHFPYFIRVDDKLAGFALVRRGSRLTGSPDVMDIAEFFVLRGLRALGVGTAVAHALFASWEGTWEIRVRPSNVEAMPFWSRVRTSWQGRPLPAVTCCVKGVTWNVFHIEP